eukprot:CAMPEP_0184352190 /NCGR_PEP_ID=MMETSP1089-20130417/62044_1 /TAXON_ID=38269 ORGANISM="Gloeochaete wittrockiana, Strain SAG46.84" /NCGR_SAMPLE_ID=MMETSP1089 /ASSEMBLY_ACC=CAM_ASM_000445 /LENGTH=45 /DNA_ID= /DNA_START= /DNA_END= /DNA_ORIENTATION=
MSAMWWVGQGRALAGAGRVLGADAKGVQREEAVGGPPPLPPECCL